MDTCLFRPPVLVGERIVWLGSGSGLPQGGIVRWMGNLPEMGSDLTVGIELDNPLPYGGIDGTWGSRHLFTCEPKHGLLVPVTKTVKERDLYQWSKDSIACPRALATKQLLAVCCEVHNPCYAAMSPFEDVEKFILEVKRRPSPYKKNMKEYSDRNLKGSGMKFASQSSQTGASFPLNRNQQKERKFK